MDESQFERAALYAERERQAALDQHRQRSVQQQQASAVCEECGDPIPPARQQAVNAVLCVDCQTYNEQRERAR